MITQKLITKNRPYRKLKELRGIVIHWTANTRKGANSQAHYLYFNNANRSASAHYFVDDKSILQLIPDDEVAWHVGDSIKLANLPIRAKYVPKGDNPNNYFIAIEMCVNEDADQQKVIDSTVRLVTDLMLKYKLTKDQVVRHYDITGKDCPKMFVPLVVNGVKLEHAWLAFKDKLPITPEQPIVMSRSLSTEETKLTTWELLLLSLHQILAFIRKM